MTRPATASEVADALFAALDLKDARMVSQVELHIDAGVTPYLLIRRYIGIDEIKEFRELMARFVAGENMR